MQVSTEFEVMTDAAGAPPCATQAGLYLHGLLDEPPPVSEMSQAVWQEHQRLLSQARSACASCPLMVDCMYRAVVQVDVSGYVGCTTHEERRMMREMLGITVESEDLDSAAGVRAEGRPLDHDRVLLARATHPGDSLEALAGRLGCSLSTVKRHLRRARHEAGCARTRVRPSDRAAPSVEDVLDCFDSVVEQYRQAS